MPPLNPRAMESAADFMRRVAKIDVLRCPDCGVGTLKAVEVVVGLPRLPSPAEAVRRQGCRGPPSVGHGRQTKGECNAGNGTAEYRIAVALASRPSVPLSPSADGTKRAI